MNEDVIVEISFEHFRLEIWEKAPRGEKRLRLFRGLGHDDELPVQPRSLEILEVLVCPEPQRTVSRSDIIDHVWKSYKGIDNVDTQVSALRKALGDERPFRLIGNVRGIGYEFLKKVRRNTRPARRPILPSINEASEGQVRAAFDEFFNLTTEDHGGVIILQSDLIDRVLPGLGRSRSFVWSKSRFYKARYLLNMCDTYGATFIQEEFNKQQRKTPKLVFSDHNSKDDPSQHAAALRISMGLGFNDLTTRTMENRICGQWMRVSKPTGDALSLHKKLVLSSKSPRLKSEMDAKNRGFRRLLPSDWSRKDYVKTWMSMLPPNKGPDVQDYAMIFRHTRMGPVRQTLFIVAGFTERGTAIGGAYLAENWKNLWERFVRGRVHRDSLGDFLILIEGPSDTDRLSEWTEVPEFEITPEKLKAKCIKCEWAGRLARN